MRILFEPNLIIKSICSLLTLTSIKIDYLEFFWIDDISKHNITKCS